MLIYHAFINFYKSEKIYKELILCVFSIHELLSSKNTAQEC